MTFTSIMQTIVTTHVLWYVDDSHTSLAARVCTWSLSWKFEVAYYLPQMVLCNSGKIAVTYYNINMYLPTTDAAAQQHLL